MLSINGPRLRTCQGMSRRELVRAGGRPSWDWPFRTSCMGEARVPVSGIEEAGDVRQQGQILSDHLSQRRGFASRHF